jgi:hypothetical protein
MPIYKSFHKIFLSVLIFAFLGTSLYIPEDRAGEVVMPVMPAPGNMVSLSSSYVPAHLMGMTIHPDNALKFDFLIHKGDGNLTQDQKRQEYIKLLKYFLTSLTIPDKDLWVNLSPYEHNRIIADDFGKTEMGRDLLGQDYLLKQITSSLMYPESGLGKSFWNKVYATAFAKYGNTNVPVNTFNKVWIVPDQATIYENKNTAYIIQSHLKVMLEEDYLALNKHQGQPGESQPSDGLKVKAPQGNNPNAVPTTHSIASKIVKEIILPELEKEVNEGKNFAQLRQIISGMILAVWYKKALKESLLGKIYVDKGKVKGINQDPKTNEEIYQQYLISFKKGVYNYIKEDEDKYTHRSVPRKYFAGGFHLDEAMVSRITDVTKIKKDPALMVSILETNFNSMDQVAIVLKGDTDAAMSDKEPPSKRFVQQINTLSRQLYKNQEPRSGQFSQAFKKFLDRIDPVLTDSMNSEELYNMGHLFQPIFESSHLLDNNYIYTIAMEEFNNQAKRRLKVFKNDHGLAVGSIRDAIAWQLIAGYYLFLVHVRMDNSHKHEARQIINLIYIVWLKSIAVRYGGVMSPYTGFYHESSHIGHDSWEQVTELLKYLYRVRNREDVKSLLTTLNNLCTREDERERPRNLEVIVPNVLMAMIPIVIGRPILRTSKDPEEIERHHNQILRMHRLITDLHNLLSNPNTLERISSLTQYSSEAELILSDLFMIGKYEFYNRDFFSFHRYSSEEIWSLEQELSAATLIIMAREYINLEKATIPKVIGDLINIQQPKDGDFAMMVNQDGPNTVDAKFRRSTVINPEIPGGIDLNSANLAMTIKRYGNGVPLPLAQQDMAQLSHIEGFEPHILEITPVNGLPILDELKQKI